MKTLLLLHPEKETREMLAFSLESKFNAPVIEASSVSDVIKQLSVNPSIGLILYSDSFSTKSDFKEYVQKTAKIPQVVVSSKPLDTAQNAALIGSIQADNIVESAYELIDKLISEGKLKPFQGDSDYCRIRTNLLVKVSPLKGDVYIRLSQDHFVKLFHEGDRFEKEDLEKYLEKKKIEYLYLKNSDTPEFVEKYKATLIQALTEANATPEKTQETVINAHETIAELSTKIGFTPQVREMTKTNVQLAIKAMGTNPTLRGILMRIEKEKGRYISSHSTVLANIACAIAKGMAWSSDATYFKLSLAAFLHDISLKNDNLAKIRTLKELEERSSEFSPGEITAFQNHPADGAKVAQQFTEVPPDVDTVIIQHHERPDGSGFPRKLAGPYINQLSAVFIVAHEIVQQTLAEGKTIDSIIKEMKELYTTGTFKKIVQSLESSLSQIS